MKIISLALISMVLSINFICAQSSIQNSVDQFCTSQDLIHASVGFKLIDLEAKTIVSEHNSALSLPTASTAKLFSTATALEILGSDYKAKTRIYYEGSLDSNGVLNGNLWLRGGGDPSLGSTYFNAENEQSEFLNKWAKQIEASGITKINGKIIADASEFGYNGAPDGWNWVDLGNYYGAGPSGLSIFDNMLQIRFKTSSSAGELAQINSMSPEIPGMTFHNYIESSTKPGDNAYIYGAPYSMDRFAIGTLPLNKSSFLVKGSIPDPELQCGYELREALIRNNIPVSGDVETARNLHTISNDDSYKSRELILTHEGTKLIDVINQINERSINLFAEHMINLLGYEKTGNGSTESGLQVMEDYWAAIFNTEGLRLNDGSGLSRTNAISADNFIDLLSYMSNSKNSLQFSETLPVAGISGTLRNVCKGQAAQSRMLAKSGSMTRIMSYAGYINSVNGKKYAFAIIVNNYTCSSSELKRKMETIFNKIALN